MEEVTQEIKDEVTDVELKEETVVNTNTLFVPQRLEGESFDEYKERRVVANYKLHQMAKGNLIWDSRKQGTYKK
jgi:hypothetical protein